MKVTSRCPAVKLFLDDDSDAPKYNQSIEWGIDRTRSRIDGIEEYSHLRIVCIGLVAAVKAVKLPQALKCLD